VHKARDIATIVAAKAGIGAAVLIGGFRAVSDDDFARVVLAQQWAAHPTLDPTGTSWLPAPFWLYGSAMAVAGTSLTVARSLAFALGLASAALIYAAARLMLQDARGALIGALLAAVLPWSARLGVATVPELPTAALSVFAIATLTHDDRRLRIWGALALLAACLSRYEPWPLAATFIALTLWDLARRRADVAHLLGSAALAASGPIAWMAHNAAAHGSALHFAERVTAYKRAVGAEPATLASVLAEYPLSLLREEPELCIVSATLAIGAALSRQRLPPKLPRVALMLLAILGGLSLAALPGGAPTHHAGRALLAIWLVMAIFAGAGARAALHSKRATRIGFTVVTLTAMLLGAFMLRPWYARPDSYTARAAETEIGAAVAKQAPAASVVLLEAIDYGFFAVQAGSGRPDDFVLDRSLDPRNAVAASSFNSPRALRTRALEANAQYVLGHRTSVTDTLGPPLATAGQWGLWKR